MHELQRFMERWVTMRLAVILAALNVAAGRLGLLNVGSVTVVPKLAYGLAFAVAAVWLAWSFHNGRRLSWSGRLGAVFAMAWFVTLAIDVLPAVSSSLFLAIFALLALAEAVTWLDY